MRQLIIKDISGSINFLFNNEYLVRTIRAEERIDDKLKTSIYITGIENWIVPSFGLYNVFGGHTILSYENMIDMFSFIVAYFNDKNVNELCISYGGTLETINNKCRDLFKVLGFKIPRRKREYLRYIY